LALQKVFNKFTLNHLKMKSLDLTKYGIKGTTEIVHNPSYEQLFKDETYPNLQGFERGQADISFDSQSTFIFPLAGKKDAFVFMADRWRPRNPSDGRYIWLPLEFEDGLPVLRWRDSWSPAKAFKK
jgi:hypothetical protein